MKRSRWIVWFLYALALRADARAQLPFDWGTLDGRYQNGVVVLHYAVNSTAIQGNATGIDVYRSAFGSPDCLNTVRITAQPLPWVGAGQSLTIDDSTAAPGNGYRYEVRPVDAARNTAVGPAHAIIGWATTGVTLLLKGHVDYEWGAWMGYTAWPCSGWCMTGGTLVSGFPAELTNYANTGTPLVLYGEIVGAGAYYNIWTPALKIASAAPQQCVVAVTPETWSGLKSLYR